MELAQFLLNLFPEVIFSFVDVLIFDCLPFVYCYNYRATLFDYRTNKRKVIDDHGRKGIHNVYYNVTLLDMCHRADLYFSKILLIIFSKVGSVETCGIYQLYFTLFVLQARSDAVSCGMGNLWNNHSFLADELVDHSRFTDVGSTDQTNFDDAA